MLILVRHGQSEANVNGVLAGRSSSPLTERGRTQAAQLASVLTGARRALSSPLSRALETGAQAVPHLTLEIDEAFIEQDYGVHDGRALAEVPLDQWREFRDRHDLALGGGESLADVDARVYARLVELFETESELISDPVEHLVVFSHVSPIKSAVTWALGVHGEVAWRMRLDNASITTLACRDSGPFLVGYNDVSHWRHLGPAKR